MTGSWTARGVAAAGAVTMTLTLGSCGSSDGSSSAAPTTKTVASTSTPSHAYPVAIEKNFSRTCIASSRAAADGKLTAEKAADYCRRTLTCVEGKLTLDRFKKLDSGILSGEANPDAKTARDCAEASVAALK